MKKALLSFVFVFLFGCEKDIHNHPDLISGKQLFDNHCSDCHKVTGMGAFLKGIPANKGTKLSVEQISEKIISGKRDDSKMTIFPSMDKEESEKISHYIKSL